MFPEYIPFIRWFHSVFGKQKLHFRLHVWHWYRVCVWLAWVPLYKWESDWVRKVEQFNGKPPTKYTAIQNGYCVQCCNIGSLTGGVNAVGTQSSMVAVSYRAMNLVVPACVGFSQWVIYTHTPQGHCGYEHTTLVAINTCICIIIAPPGCCIVQELFSCTYCSTLQDVYRTLYVISGRIYRACIL